MTFEDQSLSREEFETEEETTEEEGFGAGSGEGVGNAPGILQGGFLLEVPVGDNTQANRFYAVYEFPAGSRQFVAYQFNDLEQVKATFGVDRPNFLVRRESWFNQSVLAEGAAEEVIGREGSWARFTRDLMFDAAAAAGARDPTQAGRLASNPEMQQIMAQAIAGDWTPQQVLAEQRKTDFWKNELYPGIENFYTRTDNPERAWKEYQANVRPALQALGYEPDASGTFNTQLKRMLDKKIDAGAFLQQVPTFIRATQNADFAATLNQWAEQDLGKSVDFNDWFDLMAGESSPELDAVAEKATLAFSAQQQGSNVSQRQIEDLAARSQLSEAEAVAAFSEFNRSVLALGESGLQRGGLTRDEVLSMAAGVDPQSGRSIDEVRLQVAKIARENDLFDEEKINFFVGFTPQGTPERPGLQALSPEGA